MIKIGQRPATIDTPIEHLMACHRRIEDRLATLERAGGLLESDRESQRTEALDAISAALRFLDSSGAMHTTDEETSLFPRLAPHLNSAELEYVHSLEHQHRETDAAYAELKAALREQDAARYRDSVARLTRLYRDHIASEDDVLTGLARRCLSHADLSAITAEMRGRRQRR